MTQGPNENNPYEPTPPTAGPPPADQPGYYGPPPTGGPVPGPAPYGGHYGAMGAPMGSPGAPYGVHPMTGIPYSDKQKIVAGLLQILIPIGIGRFYIGDSKTGVLQLLVTIFTCGLGALWPFIDGIIMLVNDTKDANGYMLR